MNMGNLLICQTNLRIWSKLFIGLALACTCGCSATPKHRPGLIMVYSQPAIQCQKDPSIKFDSYNTFTTEPASEFNKKFAEKTNLIIEKQMLYQVRNSFEDLGYKFVQKDNADMIISLIFSNEYKEQYVPPQLNTYLWYVPGQSYTTNATAHDSYGNYAYGTANTYSSGQYVPMTYTTPGYYVGRYYPYMNVIVFDRKTGKIIWSSSGIVNTSQSDVRISGTFLLQRILFSEVTPSFPYCIKMRENYPLQSGVLGFAYSYVTENGNDFYPRVDRVMKGSPADLQGLRVYDLITEVDGQPTVNLSLSDSINLFSREKGQTIDLGIKRGNKRRTISFVCIDREIAQKNWHKIRTISFDGKVRTQKLGQK